MKWTFMLVLCEPFVSLLFSLSLPGVFTSLLPPGGKCYSPPPLFSPFACFYVWLSPLKAGWTTPAVGRHWAHRRLFYLRLQEGQIQNQWGNCSAALNSISEAPDGRIINMTHRGKRRDERKRRATVSRAVTRVKCETHRCNGSSVFLAKQNFILWIRFFCIFDYVQLNIESIVSCRKLLQATKHFSFLMVMWSPLSRETNRSGRRVKTF